MGSTAELVLVKLVAALYGRLRRYAITIIDDDDGWLIAES
jgi:hypothetical protein